MEDIASSIYGSARSAEKAHYRETANIPSHYTKSQYVYEVVAASCNNHLPLSLIPTAISTDDVNWPDCVAANANENKLPPAEGYCLLLLALKVAHSRAPLFFSYLKTSAVVPGSLIYSTFQ